MGRRFFLTFRVFEISRALIFTEETFLSKQGWQGLHGQIWTGGDVEDWHPKEALFDLMVSCSCLGNRGFRLVQALHEFPEQKKHQELQAISVQGSLLQDGLRDWKSAALTWHPPLSAARDDQMTLALIFHHASTVYLSGLFDYFPYWNERQIPTPTLSASVAQEHVRAILSMTVAALKETTLAGILFLFPLRVAGARASSAQQRNVIAGMLEDISRRGFVVADAFTADLKELWGHRREEIGGDQLDKEIADSSNVG
ncbi:hypothetical protein MMC18_001348 [Xylographa bjoerkii]|nr:hypothetical protein [Xylographa bjoerkii]